MRRILILVLATINSLLYVSAQNKASIVQRINEIKSQSDIYLWDQFTHTNVETAKVGSAKRLVLHIETYIENEFPFTVEDLINKASFINIDRGNLKQAFAYIKKTDVDKWFYPQKNGLEINQNKDKPVVETPVEEQTVKDTAIPIAANGKKNFVADAFVDRLMQTKTFINVYKLLKSLQAQGEILQFGKLRDVEDYSSFDLILFDMNSQEIITVLSGTNASGNRINMVNGEDDSLDNYPQNMTAVIWYIK